jgi:hypothetical protein
MKWDTIIQQADTTLTNKLILCDPLDKTLYLSSKPEYSKITIPSGYFVGIFDPKKRQHIDVIYNFENKTIGYFDRAEYNFIRAIIQSYRMNRSTIKLQQISNTNVTQLLSAIRDNKIDILITYVIVDSELFQSIQHQRVGVMGFGNLDFARVKLFYPYVSPIDAHLRKIFTNIQSSLLLIPESDNSTVLPQMTMKLVDMNSNNSKETFITQLKIDPETIEYGYRCYGNPYTESKAECESPNDLYGNSIEHVKWDKECEVNEDCPFYKKNSQYDNTRGGCLQNGLCEMPIGVLQASPRKYFDTGRFKPFCYGCAPNVDNSECCEITQDYAFVNDTPEREIAGLKTSIPLM